MQYWWLIAVSVLVGVAGQTSIKLGVSQPNVTGSDGGVFGLALVILQSPLIIFGLVLYAVGAFSWIAVLRHVDLSLAYPFLALNFVLVTLMARVALGEVVPTLRWIGIAIICFGVVVVARSTM